MEEILCFGEILKVTSPFMSGQDLASCMCVCKQWRDIAKEDYFWKKMCAQRWPSLCKDKRPPPISMGYHMLYMSLYRRNHYLLLVPRLSFDDIEFYVDIWFVVRSVYSDVIPRSLFRSGIINPPARICDIMKDHLKSLSCKMTIPINPKFKVVFGENIYVSLLVGQRYEDKFSCIIDKFGFDYVDGLTYRALAYDYLQFASKYPFVSKIKAWMLLLWVDSQDENMEVLGI